MGADCGETHPEQTALLNMSVSGAKRMDSTRYPIATMSGILVRLAVFAGLWGLITQGSADAWLVGLPAVALATLASVRLSGRALRRFSPAGLVAFLVLFVRESFAGGLDVARRTLGKQLRIQPGFRRFRLHLRDPAARVLLVNCISLLPGTLAADLENDHVELHLLDIREHPDPQLLRLEQAIARLFGLPLENVDV
jgi:multicomponent Na+:H+ antiporter subunit E